MPPPARPFRVPPWFRLRCVLCAGLTAGVWFGVARMAPLEMAPHSRPASAALASAPALTSPPEAPLPRPVRGGPAIIIDAGHGGRDPGKPAGEQLEKTWTLTISLALADELRRRGWPVELTRSDDTTLQPGERCDYTNRAPRRAFVSLHFNSGSPDAAGLEVYYAWPKSPETLARLAGELRTPPGHHLRDERGRLLAEALQSAACAATGSRNRGARNDPALAAVLTRTRCPAVLVECGFLTNDAESALIQTEAWRQKLVTGLAGGLESWLQAAETPGYGVHFDAPQEGTPINTPAVSPAP